MSVENLPTLKIGCSAYLDSFAGLVPVKVLSLTAPDVLPAFDLVCGSARASIKVRAKVTETCGAYKVGDLIEDNSLNIVPVKAIRRMRFSSVITNYRVQT